MRKASSIVIWPCRGRDKIQRSSQLIGLGAADFRVERRRSFRSSALQAKNAGVLLFVTRHLPPKIAQFRLIEKEVGESVVDFRN